MEELICDRRECKNKAVKFCINCKALLCRSHRTEDVKQQQISLNIEHYYIDVSQYIKKREMFAALYCDAHPKQTLTHKCINCFQFACNLCLPEWCSKAAGRFHDYNKMKSFVGSYKDTLSKLRLKLQLKHDIFLLRLKDACRQRDRKQSELEDLLSQIDKAVESQIVAVTEEGKKLKQSIAKEMSEISRQINMQIKIIEEKEAISRKLLCEIWEIICCPVDCMAVLNYQKCKKEMTDIIDWKIASSISPKFSLSQVPVPEYFLKLTKTMESPVDSLVDVFVEASDYQKQKDTGIIQKKEYTPDDLLQLYVFRSVLKNRLIYGPHFDNFTNLVHNSHNFIRTRGGEEISSHTCDTVVHQLLPYGNQLLLLTRDWSNKYKIRFMNKDEVLYEFTDATYSSVHFSPLYPHRLMAVTHDHKLIVLVKETQTLHVLHLETKIEKDLTLSVGKRVYAILVPCDGRLILLCVEAEKNEIWRHSVIKYDTKLRKSIGISGTLLTGGRDCQLHAACFNNFLYALSSYQPTTVYRLNLSGDGFVMQHIQCGELLPKLVFDISLRGNVLATANAEGICFYEITDVAEVAV